jgi:hypothetical protein
MRIALFFVLWLTIFACYSQDFITIRGEVKDKSTGQSLEFANVGIKGKSIGAVTNSHGAFELKLPSPSVKDSITISFIGYASVARLISEVPVGQVWQISLEPVSTELLNLVISTKPYTVHSLLQDAIDHYPENYTTSPVAMDAFYRETRQVDKKYGYLMEAAILLFKESYEERYEASLVEVRMNVYSKQFDYETNENFLRSLIMNDYIGDPFSGLFKQYSKKNDYRIEDTTYIDKSPVLVVTMGKLPEWTETYWIKVHDLAIIRFEGIGYYGSDSSQVMSKPENGRVNRYRRLHVINVYRSFEGNYHPSYMRMVLEQDLYNTKTGKSETYKILDRELMINNVERVTKKPDNAMKRYSLETQLKAYNAEFWKNYNILTRTPLQEQAIHDLEKKSKLEQQFSEQKPVKKK